MNDPFLFGCIFCICVQISVVNGVVSAEEVEPGHAQGAQTMGLKTLATMVDLAKAIKECGISSELMV